MNANEALELSNARATIQREDVRSFIEKIRVAAYMGNTKLTTNTEIGKEEQVANTLREMGYNVQVETFKQPLFLSRWDEPNLPLLHISWG